MSRKPQRTRISANKHSATNVTIKEELRGNGNSSYVTHCVQGWKEDGIWKRKRFKDRKEAERFAALKRIELENKGRKLQLHTTSLDENQLRQAEDCFDKLGGTYTLAEAVEFFLSNHRPPEYTIELKAGIKTYLDEMERAGNRPRTITGKQSVLNQLCDFLHNPEIHAITPQLAESFLRSLRAKDGTASSRKTWNNYRNDMNHFFKWCSEADLVTHRPWTFTNPCDKIIVFTSKQVADQREGIIITEADIVLSHMNRLMNFHDGALVKFYALAYFAGIRPDGELKKLAMVEKNHLNLSTRTIHIPAKISKTGQARQVTIYENLAAWLEAFKDSPIIPKNFDRLNKAFRAEVGLSRDETRHTFISFHVAKFRSVGDAALQAGNSETIVRQHYLNLRPKGEGEAFFRIVPDMKTGKAVLATPSTEDQSQLKAI